MKNKLSYAQEHPVKSIIFIEFSFLLIVFIAGAIATINQLSYTSPILISFIPTALLLIVYFTWKKKWAYYGFKRIESKKQWLYYIPLLLVLVVICFQGFDKHSIKTIAFYIGFSVLVGFVEESIYRGIMIKILLPLGTVATILTSSLLFSLSHVLNMLSGQSIGDTVLQLVYAFLIGIVLAQLFIKNKSIYPLILFHTIHNLIQFLGNGGSTTLLDITVIIILMITAIFLGLETKRHYFHKGTMIEQQ